MSRTATKSRTYTSDLYLAGTSYEITATEVTNDWDHGGYRKRYSVSVDGRQTDFFIRKDVYQPRSAEFIVYREGEGRPVSYAGTLASAMSRAGRHYVSSLVSDRAAKNNVDLAKHETVDYQVWVRTRSGGFYAYRTNLGALSVARTWADAWNETFPQDVDAIEFVAVAATTKFEVA